MMLVIQIPKTEEKCIISLNWKLDVFYTESTKNLVNSPNIQTLIWNSTTAQNLVTFTEKILNGKLHFLCSVCLVSFQMSFSEILQ